MTQTQTKERPIVLNAREVRGILDGRKTQTRRIIKPQPVWVGDPCVPFKTADADPMGIIHCPYGKPGDRLWVKEKWRPIGPWSNKHLGSCTIEYADGSVVRHDAPDGTKIISRLGRNLKERWKSPLHLPRWASRITLEIVGVRVERLREISEADVFSEGLQRCIYRHGSKPHITFCDDGPDAFVPDPVMPEGGRVHPPIAAFHELWDETNGPGAWERNDFVWVLSFRRVEGGAA